MGVVCKRQGVTTMESNGTMAARLDPIPQDQTNLFSVDKQLLRVASWETFDLPGPYLAPCLLQTIIY